VCVCVCVCVLYTYIHTYAYIHTYMRMYTIQFMYIKWKLDIYAADGYYIKECIDNNRDKHVYIDFYNTILEEILTSLFTLWF
jgi:hypothetical protein